MTRLYHILCTNRGRIVYEAKVLCSTRKTAMTILRDQIGRRSLAGLTYSISEIPVDIIRDVVESILAKKEIKGGVIVPFRKEALDEVPDGKYIDIQNNKYSPRTPEIGTRTRRLGDL